MKTCEDCYFDCKSVDNEPCERFRLKDYFSKANCSICANRNVCPQMQTFKNCRALYCVNYIKEEKVDI